MKRTVVTAFAYLGFLATAQAAENIEIAPNTTRTDNKTIHLQDDSDSLVNYGQYNVQKVQIHNGTIVNHGTISEIFENENDTYSDLLHIMATGGSIINYGRIEGTTTVNYGTFVAMDGSYMENLDLYNYNNDGLTSLQVQGNITINGTFYTEESAEIVFTLSGSINMMGNDLENWGAKLVLIIDDSIEVGDSTTSYRYLEKNDLFTNVGQGNITGDTTIILRDSQGNETTRKYNELSTVPEPTTVTLSLLALSSLAMRRRRIER